MERTEISEIGGEFALIDRIAAATINTLPETVKGIGDDAAVIDSGEFYTVVSTDMLGLVLPLFLSQPAASGGPFALPASSIGLIFAAYISRVARQPEAQSRLQSIAILGFALSEAMGLFCLMMAFLLLFAF